MSDEQEILKTVLDELGEYVMRELEQRLPGQHIIFALLAAHAVPTAAVFVTSNIPERFVPHFLSSTGMNLSVKQHAESRAEQTPPADPQP